MDQQGKKRPLAHHCCEICGRPFTRNTTLVRHQQTVHHEEPEHCHGPSFSCPECDFTSPREDTVKRHIKETHRKRRRHANQTTPSSSTAGLLPHSAATQSLKQSVADLQSQLQQPDHFATGDSLKDEVGFLSEIYVASTNALLPVEEAVDDDLARGMMDFEFDFENTLGLTHESVAGCFTSGAEELTTWSVEADGKSEESGSTAESARTTPNTQVACCVVPKRERGTYLRLCTICHQPFGKSGGEVKKHMDRHMQQLSGSSDERRCEECDMGFVHEQDLNHHKQISQRGDDCGFKFKHENPCTGHHPPSEVRDRKAFENKVRDWELSQHMRYRLQIDDCAEKGGRANVPSYGNSKPAMRRSLGSISSLRTCFTKFSTPTDVDYHALRNGQSKPGATGTTHFLKSGLNTVRSHMARRGSLAQVGQEVKPRRLKDQVIEAMRDCDKNLMSVLLSSDESASYGSDSPHITTWSLFELLDRCDDMESGFKPDFKIGNIFPVLDVLVEHDRVTPGEVAELAAGNDYQIFVRYIRSGVQVNLDSMLIQDAFCKAIFSGDQDVVAAMLLQGAGMLLTKVAQMECFSTTETIQNMDQLPFDQTDHELLATALISNGEKVAGLLHKVAYNPCAEAVSYEVKHKACDKCADHYRSKHHSFQKFNAGHSHRLHMLTRACVIDQLKVRLARCFLPRVARDAFRELVEKHNHQV